MKSYDETARDVLQRINEYKSKRSRRIKFITVTASLCCLIAVVCVFFFKSPSAEQEDTVQDVQATKEPSKDEYYENYIKYDRAAFIDKRIVRDSRDASVLFGHQVVECTYDDFTDYEITFHSMDGSLENLSVALNYRFENGLINTYYPYPLFWNGKIADYVDEKHGFFSLLCGGEEYEYNGYTFFVQEFDDVKTFLNGDTQSCEVEASEVYFVDRIEITYVPNNGMGLIYVAGFDKGTLEKEEIMDRMLKLVIDTDPLTVETKSVNYSEAVSLFEHPIIELNFNDGYNGHKFRDYFVKLRQYESGETVCADLLYVFEDGVITLTDQDRLPESMNVYKLLNSGADSVVETHTYIDHEFFEIVLTENKHTFKMITYCPDNENGIAYTAVFDGDSKSDKIIDRILDIVIE